MLRFLFGTLTSDQSRGRSLFDSATRVAREPHWYREGSIADTLDGRFAVLATIIALVVARLEEDGDLGNVTSVALTERFIEVMESEHRELGLGDPTLGNTVRKLVGMLARRTELWRAAKSGEKDWAEATHQSLYGNQVPACALSHSSEALARFRDALRQKSLTQLEEGIIA